MGGVRSCPPGRYGGRGAERVLESAFPDLEDERVSRVDSPDKSSQEGPDTSARSTPTTANLRPPPVPDASNDGSPFEVDDGTTDAPSSETQIPTGRFKRFMKLSALTANTSTRYLGQRLRGLLQDRETRARSMLETHRRTAERAVEVMGELKGAVMKVGQMVSLHPEDGILPPELTRAFSRLQSHAPTLPYPAIRRQVEQELGAPPDKLFARFDPHPMAAASLGQVHAATLSTGAEVVVKVQYPGIGETIESDLWQLRKVLGATGLVGRKDEADLVFSELKDRLAEELDYEQEAANMARFRHYFAGHHAIKVPADHPEFSSRRVLTMERLDGLELEHVLLRHPDRAWRDRLGRRVFDLLLEQMFHFRCLHADPQLGNFRFLDDGTIILLDFGCVKRLDERFIVPYLDLVHAAVTGDEERMQTHLAELGVLEPGRPEAFALVVEFSRVVLEPLRSSPYQFGDAAGMLRRLRALAPRFLAHPEIRAHPDMVYLHRTLAGMFFMLCRIEARADWWGIFLQHRARAAQAPGNSTVPGNHDHTNASRGTGDQP